MVHIFGKGLSKALERDKLEANFGHFQHTVNPGKSNAFSLSTLVVTGVGWVLIKVTKETKTTFLAFWSS